MVQIKNHFQRALSLLVAQFQQKLPDGSLTNFQTLIKILVKPAQDLEDVKWQLKTERWLQTSVGVQLDLLADLFNLSRNVGESDEDFRERIIFQIYILKSSGTPEDIIKALSFFTDASYVVFKDLFPAYFELETDGEKFPNPPNDVNDAIFSISPAGVNYAPIVITNGEEISFQFSGDLMTDDLYVAPNLIDPTELTTLEMDPYGALLNVTVGATENQFGEGSFQEFGVDQEDAGFFSDLLQKEGNSPPRRF